MIDIWRWGIRLIGGVFGAMVKAVEDASSIGRILPLRSAFLLELDGISLQFRRRLSVFEQIVIPIAS